MTEEKREEQEQPVEQPKVEETPAEKPAVDEKPKEEVKPEVKPAEEPKVEEKPKEEVKPAEKPATEAAPEVKPSEAPKAAETTPEGKEKKRKKINIMSLKDIEAKLADVKEKMKGLKSRYAKQLLKQKDVLTGNKPEDRK